MRYLFAAIALWAAVINPTRADWVQKLVHIACIPELGVLRIEHIELDGTFFPDGYMSGEKSTAGMGQWRKHGYHDETKLDYVCKLPGATYKFKSRVGPGSERGQCGAAPAAHIDFSIDDKALLKQLPFGDECGAPPSVRSITVFDRRKDGEQPVVKVCIAAHQFMDWHEVMCEYREGSKIVRDGPIDYAKMRVLYDAARPQGK